LKPWSISTTVRNPERLRNFLKVLKLLEGKPFTTENQIRYQILLIQNRYYKPETIQDKYRKYYEDLQSEIPYEVAKEIFYYQDYEDPPMRGRQSVNPLNKMGFSIVRETEGEILITQLGNQFLAGNYDIGYIFFKSLLKIQFPNPWSSDFSEKDGFDVVPFIAAMHLVNKVNQESDVKGLTKTEFSLFIPTLINYQLITDYAERIKEYRKAKNKETFINDFARHFYQKHDLTEKQIKNFFEYGDNIMRYFRLTRYFKVSIDSFGADWRIDLEPMRKVEIEQLLKQYSGQSVSFNTNQDYINYISDISLPKLPSEDEKNLQDIAHSLIKVISDLTQSSRISLSNDELLMLKTDYKALNRNDINRFINLLRQTNLDLLNRIKKASIVNNEQRLKEIIAVLKSHKDIRKFAPEQFEKLLAESLQIINDEIRLKPNYPVDDNGEPISHSPGNQPDIECFYKSYNIICEVTLDTSNFQWIRETQPVMRHLREFEIKNHDLRSYCLFIAPKIHVDTLYHFWMSIKHGYDGTKQFIVPLTTEYFSFLLETLLLLINNGKRLNHLDLENLYKKVIEQTDIVKGHTDWLLSISTAIDNWKREMLAL
jgi:hypothetical protein